MKRVFDSNGVGNVRYTVKTETFYILDESMHNLRGNSE